MSGIAGSVQRIDARKGKNTKIKKLIRSQIKETLKSLLEKSLFEDTDIFQVKKVMPQGPSLCEDLEVYGTLTNSSTKESDLIIGARVEYIQSAEFVYYTVSNRDLFKFFPAAGTYQGPYATSKPVFIEIVAGVENLFICKTATQLRYLELLSLRSE